MKNKVCAVLALASFFAVVLLAGYEGDKFLLWLIGELLAVSAFGFSLSKGGFMDGKA